MTTTLADPLPPPALAPSGGLVLAPLPRNPLRVLCVDDNEDAADALGWLLRIIGFETEVCHDADAALAAVERFRPEACLLDVTMPGTDGCDLARALRTGGRGDALLLVAVTAHGDRATIDRTAAAGFDHHLTKPAEPQQLLDVLFAFEQQIRSAD